MMRSGLTGSGSGSQVKVRARDLKGSWSKLFGYLGAYKPALVFALILAIGSTAASIFGPIILGNAITILYEGVLAVSSGSGAIDLARIGNWPCLRSVST